MTVAEPEFLKQLTDTRCPLLAQPPSSVYSWFSGSSAVPAKKIFKHKSMEYIRHFIFAGCYDNSPWYLVTNIAKHLDFARHLDLAGIYFSKCPATVTIHAPAIYTAPCIMFWMVAYTLRGEVGGGWALEFPSFLGPVKWERADRLVPFGAQKTREFQGPTPSHFPK
jgi:hypothetical protein